MRGDIVGMKGLYVVGLERIDAVGPGSLIGKGCREGRAGILG